MRIVILSDRIPPEGIGGAEKVAWALARQLRSAGHDVRVIASTAGRAFNDERDGLPTYHLHAEYPVRWRGWLSLYNPQTAAPLKRLLETIQPDVVHAHNIHQYLSYNSLRLSHRMGFPTVFTAHDTMPFTYTKLDYFIDPAHCGVRSPENYRLPELHNLRQMQFQYNPLRNPVIAAVLRRYTDARTCVSQAQRQALEINGLPPFEAVYNGVDPASFEVPDRVIDSLKQRLHLEGRRVILYGGRVTKTKGSLQLLAALSQVVERVPSALLMVLTAANLDQQGFNDPAYRQLLQNHIVAGGWLSGLELAAAYRLADVVTLPSIYLESFGMMALEGMAASKPVVATCYGGPAEIVLDGETGFVVNPFDTATYADRLVQLLTDAPLARRMGDAGRQRLGQLFTLSLTAGNMLAIYEKAIGNRIIG